MNYGGGTTAHSAKWRAHAIFPWVKGYSVSTYSTKKELAQQFIEFINQPEYAKIRFEKTGEIPPVKSLIDDPVIKGDEKARAVAIQGWLCRSHAKCTGNARSVDTFQ